LRRIRRVALIGRRLIAFDEFGRHSRCGAGNAIREYGNALTGQLLFRVEHVRIEHFGRIELAALGASAQERQKQKDGGEREAGADE
jgi:hypothetical protein